MWEDYSKDYIRNNRASGISIRIAAFISALFLSLLCCLSYNDWNYEVESAILGEGDRQDTSPSLLMFFALAVLLAVSVSLILIIHNSFAVSMNARIHQFGIFSSIGATPGQIRICLLQEAAILSLAPILIGSFTGIAVSFGLIKLVNVLAEDVAGRHEAVFAYHPLVFVITILASVLTVFISAWLPAKSLSRLTPIEAIRNTGELQLKRSKESRILKLMFGAEGELAGNALTAQKKALRTSALSLTLSFLGFTAMLCFFTLSEISTNHTYFERYQNAWDVMATVKDAKIENFAYGNAIHDLDHTDSVIYQFAEARCIVPEDSVSDEVKGLGGLSAIAGNAVSAADGSYMVKAPVVIMDDSSFSKYCEQTGAAAARFGSVILNRIWDSRNSNFRYKEYIPFLSESLDSITLKNITDSSASAKVPVLGYTKDPPVLREEYDNYALVQFISLSTWQQLRGTIGNEEADMSIRVLSETDRSLTELNVIEAKLANILGRKYTFEMENRVQERIDNDAMLKGYKIVIGAVCVLLALIGIANVFSNTLGFIRQRKREFARYMSIGMTPAGMRKMFGIEALAIAGRPVLITLPLTLLLIWFMTSASYLDPMEFWSAAPIIPVVLFISAIFGFVALAYYLGGRQILKCNLVEALQSDNTI